MKNNKKIYIGDMDWDIGVNMQIQCFWKMFHNSSGSKTIILEMKFTSIFRDYNSGKKLYIGRIHSAKSYALEGLKVKMPKFSKCPKT